MWHRAHYPLMMSGFLGTSESTAASTTPNVESYWALTYTVPHTYSRGWQRRGS